MTDNDIIKALDHELFINQSEAGYFRAYCDGVPKWILIEALSLINRQKAEIERLQEKYSRTMDGLKAVLAERADHSEAIKEYMDKVIFEIVNKPAKFKAEEGTADFLSGMAHRQNQILDIIKEMVGDE